ncbi:hypothetical protein Tco_0862562 [Tanacetum coccineum]
MAQENYIEGCYMQRPPLLELNGFWFWKARFETYDNEAKMTLYNALPLKNCKIDLLTQEYEKFSNSNEETIDSGFTRFNAIVTSLKSLDPDHSSKNHVRKFLRALPMKWRAKVTAIEEAKDLGTLSLDELIKNLKVYEMVLDNDGVGSKITKENVKSLALKANITRGQTSNNSTCQDESDEDEEINLMAKNFKLKKKGYESSRRKRECYNYGNKNHLADNYPKPNNKALVGVSWSDSEDDDETQNDATCPMEIV